VQGYEQIVSNAAKELSEPLAEIVLDARSHGRYATRHLISESGSDHGHVHRYMASDPEPRPGLPSGHIPHSFSLPFNAFLQTNTIPHSSKTFTTFLPPNELHQKLADAVGTEYAQLIIEGKRGVTTTCGSGMTAGILWLGLKLIEESASVALYDEVRYTQLIDRLDKPLMLARSLGRVMRRARRARLIRGYHSCL
jgi:thiosulfate/3-mercaptopyruvate sulfurtransferase